LGVALSKAEGRAGGFRRYDPRECVVFRKTREQFGGLSNMAADYPVRLGDTELLTVEALYQACRFPDRPDVQARILRERSPMSAKRIARIEASSTRADWMRVRPTVMRWCLRVKLGCAWTKFSELLLSTEDRAIVEFSPRDTFWAAVPIEDGRLLEGCNVLGRLLMELRNVRRDAPETLQVVSPPAIPNFRLFDREIASVMSGSRTA
jgi:type I restriction enzyme S subunit